MMETETRFALGKPQHHMTDQSFTVWLLGRRYDVIRNGKEYIVKTGSDLVTDADEFNQVVGKIERMEQILGKNSHLIKPQ